MQCATLVRLYAMLATLQSSQQVSYNYLIKLSSE